VALKELFVDGDVFCRDEAGARLGLEGRVLHSHFKDLNEFGGKAQDVQAPEVERAIDRIGAAAKKAGKISGIYCRDAERALAMAKRGFRFITVGSDQGFLRDGAAAQWQALKG